MEIIVTNESNVFNVKSRHTINDFPDLFWKNYRKHGIKITDVDKNETIHPNLKTAKEKNSSPGSLYLLFINF